MSICVLVNKVVIGERERERERERGERGRGERGRERTKRDYMTSVGSII